MSRRRFAAHFIGLLAVLLVIEYMLWPERADDNGPFIAIALIVASIAIHPGGKE